MNIKNAILLLSAGLVSTATVVGLSTAILARVPETIARASTVGGILALGSVGLFFVGLAFPKNTKEV